MVVAAKQYRSKAEDSPRRGQLIYSIQQRNGTAGSRQPLAFGTFPSVITTGNVTIAKTLYVINCSKKAAEEKNNENEIS